MKTKLLPLIGVFYLLSCTQNKSVSQSKTDTKSDTYGMVISFYSICCGIDNKAFTKFQNTLKDHPTVKSELYRWGKEGEKDYCLKFDNLSTKEQINFNKKIQQIADSSELMRVTKNTSCVHKN